MTTYSKLTPALILTLGWLSAGPLPASDAKPATNDFILRTAAGEAAGIAARNGLTIISQVDTPTDPEGRSVYLVRAAASTPPEVVIGDVEALEPTAVGIEEVFLASLPELDQSSVVILDTTAAESALGAIDGFAPPAATVDATWNSHLHDREIEIGHTATLELEFENVADTSTSSYGVQVEFGGGVVATYDPSSCAAVVEQYVDIGGQEAKWYVANTTNATITLSSISVGWPAANGDLIEIKLGGAKIYDQVLPPSTATVDSGWLAAVDKREIDPGQALELRLKWQNGAGVDAAAYTLDVATVEGHSAQFDSAGGPCAGHVDGQMQISGSEVRFEVTNYAASDLAIDRIFFTWPAENGKLIAARLDDKSLLDDAYEEFGEYPDGSRRDIWTGYLNQSAAQLLEVDEAQEDFRGEATVAIIDTGIDPNHELLADVVVPGYDFINDVAGIPSEMAGIDQSSVVILDQSSVVILDGSGVVPLSQSSVVILDEAQETALDTSTLPDGFGHGTMVAGIVHRVAPEAKLMPLRAFDGNGDGHLYDIIEAIYYAVDHGANVINMSFSMETFSSELMRAINYAARNGVACVAAAGNLGEEIQVFPAALGNTIGVASVDESGALSSFSNWGSDLVTISAPGQSVLTTFPGGGWAVASGTSFAAPWISGAAALFADKLGTKHAPGKADYYLSSTALSAAEPVVGSGQGKSGHGRANLRKAIERIRSGKYSDDQPLGVYSLAASFAEGCTANYPPPEVGSGCTALGAGQLAFAGKRVRWRVTNDSELDITLDGLTLTWPTENGLLKKVSVDGQRVLDADLPQPTAAIISGWLGAVDDRIFAPHETLVIELEFAHEVLWTY